MNTENKSVVYIVNGFLYRNTDFNEDDLVKIQKEFKGKNVKEIRKKAFGYFKSLIEILLASKEITYQNDIQAENDLKSFFTSSKKENHPKLSNVSYDLDDDKLITISFSNNTTPEYVTKTGIKFYQDEKIIHAFGYQSELLQEKINKNLEKEKRIKNYE